jgi:hypothetical protein
MPMRRLDFICVAEGVEVAARRDAKVQEVSAANG